MTDLIQIKELRRVFGERLVLDIPEWRLARNQHCLILGPSGSGKTTLLHLLAGLDTVKTGSVHVLETDPSGLSAAERDRFRGRHFGLVFQRFHLVEALTAKQNLIAAYWCAGTEPDITHVNSLLARLDLSDRANTRPSGLSHGEAQRLAIARALVNRPSIILADEPTSALDDRNAERVCRLLLDQCKIEKATLIMATHDRRMIDRFDHRLTLEGRR